MTPKYWMVISNLPLVEVFHSEKRAWDYAIDLHTKYLNNPSFTIKVIPVYELDGAGYIRR